MSERAFKQHLPNDREYYHKTDKYHYDNSKYDSYKDNKDYKFRSEDKKRHDDKYHFSKEKHYSTSELKDECHSSYKYPNRSINDDYYYDKKSYDLRSQDLCRKRSISPRRSEKYSTYTKKYLLNDHSSKSTSNNRNISRAFGSDRVSTSIIEPHLQLTFPELVKPPTMPSETTTILVDEDEEMMKLLGFSGFSSTKGQHVIGTDVYAVSTTKPLKYRQYMNRLHGFNKPLQNYTD